MNFKQEYFEEDDKCMNQKERKKTYWDVYNTYDDSDF